MTAIVFVLTMFEIYRSQIPLKSTKVIRKDVAQVSRITEAFDGTFLYFCSLVVPKKLSPTNLSIKCQTCQVCYFMANLSLSQTERYVNAKHRKELSLSLDRASRI